MKMKSLFATAMAALLLVSCTKEVEKVVYVGGDSGEEGIAKVKVSLAPNELKTKAGHYGVTPSDDELQIYNYALFIFKGSGMLETSLIAKVGSISADLYTQPLTFDKADNTDNPYLDDDGILTLSSGPKLFFAIVNAPAELLERQNEYLQSNTLTQQNAATEELTFANLSSIVGSYNSEAYNGNEQGLVYFNNTNPNNRGFMMTTLSSSGYEEKTLVETEENDAPQDIELIVGRAMAKVSLGSELQGNPGSDEEPNGTLDVFSYKIINNPTSMYLMPKYANGVIITPSFYDTAVDVNEYFESHNTISSSYTGEPLEPNYMPVSEDGARTFTYAIENSNATPKQGNATIAIVKGEFTPGGNATIYEYPVANAANATATTINKGETFYRIWIPQYTRTDNNELAGNRYDGAYYKYDPTEEYDAVNDPGVSWLDKYVEDLATTSAWNASQMKQEIKVDEFVDGICYYRLPLYNNNSNAATMPHSVKRNTYYMIDIVSVKEAGYTEEDKGGGGEPIDPEEPLEPQSKIEVSIKVEDWEKVEQSGGL